MHITHNPTAQRFITTIDGTTAYLAYDIVDDHTLNYNHTIVPAELGGRGVGSALATFALDYAKDHHKTIVPSCSFVARFIEKNPQYQTLLSSSWQQIYKLAIIGIVFAPLLCLYHFYQRSTHE